MKNLILLFLFIFILFACSGGGGDSGKTNATVPANGGGTVEDVTKEGSDTGETGEIENTPTIEQKTRYSLSGKVQKGRCMQDGSVVIQPIDDGNFDQIGGNFTGYTDDSGYHVSGEYDEEYVELFFSGWCDNELTGNDGFYKIDGLIKNNGQPQNINPLTKLRSPIARYLFNDGFGTTDESIIEAESMILDYLNMPSTDKRFTEMSIENDGTHDAILQMFAAVSLHNKNDAETGDFIRQVSTGVIENDLVLKAEIMSIYDQIPIFDVVNNLKASYGENTGIPPIWRLGFHPDYYAKLIENSQTVTGSFNIYDSGSCSFDQSTFNMFAIPHVFESWIELSDFIALNIVGDISIWTKGFDQYDRPGTKILDIQQLRENLLNGPVNLPYNGKLGDHGIVANAQYYVVIRRDENFTLTTSCGGGLLPFGRKLASQDGGLNWIGYNNNSTWFKYSGLRIFGINI
jgi:hypothetical protein